ncbi:MAG TPA: ABC transporter ATP-binding protein, partial [Candidatus Eremiobacteraeota bacterium]|nr:ABC transporter ATP-binding protein [Candidatus Eremiobacteraeota bacterium]
MNDIAIKIENLSKVYRLYNNPVERLKESLHPFRKKYHREFYALRDVSFEVKRGETVGIIGKNGSGKSTLLKIITGVLTPTGGNVTVNGKVSALLELGTGFNPEFTGMENIYFSGTIMGYTKEEIDKKVDEIVSFADIGDFINQPVKIYSSGMYVRLAFAVAINVDPEILIIDEALSVGDIAFQVKCFRKFNEFKEAGKTILFVTHSLDSILRYCNKGIVIQNGIKITETDPKDAVDVYKRLLV